METEETRESSVTDELYCYRDKDRICAPECTAWLVSPKDDKGPLTYVQRHCAMISSAERTARHLTILTQVVAEMNGRSKVAEQDRKRVEAASPPGGGGPFADPFPLLPGRKG